MFNLVRNSVEALQDCNPRQLTIGVIAASDTFLEVAVTDTGSGLSDEIADRIFQPFVTTKSSGLGFGLSICRSIVDAHRGRLWSTPNPGGGACFRFTVPVLVPEELDEC